MCAWNREVIFPELTPKQDPRKTASRGSDEAQVVQQQKREGCGAAAYANQVCEHGKVHLSRARELEDGHEEPKGQGAAGQCRRANARADGCVDLLLQRGRELEEDLGLLSPDG